MARISNPKAFAGNKPLATMFQVEALLKGSNTISTFGYAPLDADNKINVKYIPRITLTDTYVASNTDITTNGSGTVQGYINYLVKTGAIPSGQTQVVKAEQGDVLTITDGSFQGSYIITGSNGTTGTFIQLDVSRGYVTTVNGQAGPTVVLDLEDINDVSTTLANVLKTVEVKAGTGSTQRVFVDSKELALLTDISFATLGLTVDKSVLNKLSEGTAADAGKLVYGSTVLATKDEVEELREVIGAGGGTSLTERITALETAVGGSDDPANATGSLYARIADTVAKTATNTTNIGTLTTDVNDLKTSVGAAADAASATGSVYARIKQNAADISTLKTAVGTASDAADAAGSLYARVADTVAKTATNTANIATNKADIAKNKAAVQKAVELTEVTFTWTETEAATAEGVKTYTKVIDGRAIQVFDGNGDWCFPDVSYAAATNKSTIKVVMETTDTMAEEWTVCVANKITVA